MASLISSTSIIEIRGIIAFATVRSRILSGIHRGIHHGKPKLLTGSDAFFLAGVFAVRTVPSLMYRVSGEALSTAPNFGADIALGQPDLLCFLPLVLIFLPR